MRDLIGALAICFIGVITCLIVAAQVAVWWEWRERGWR
jgi:hypothetical protein